MRIGFGIDFHQLVTEREFWLGGVKIDHPKGALGHSDADVIAHDRHISFKRVYKDDL